LSVLYFPLGVPGVPTRVQAICPVVTDALISSPSLRTRKKILDRGGQRARIGVRVPPLKPAPSPRRLSRTQQGVPNALRRLPGGVRPRSREDDRHSRGDSQSFRQRSAMLIDGQERRLRQSCLGRLESEAMQVSPYLLFGYPRLQSTRSCHQPLLYRLCRTPHAALVCS
jgi:hypothetical protein